LITAFLSLLLLLELFLQDFLSHHLLLLSGIVVLQEVEEVKAGLAWLTKSTSARGTGWDTALAATLGGRCRGCLLGFGLCVCLLLCSSGSCGGLGFVRTDGSCVLLIVLHLLSEDRQLHKVIHLCLGTLDIGIVNVRHLRECLVCLFLVVKGLSIVTELIVSVCDRLIAGDHLQVSLSEDLQVSVQGLEEAVDGCLEVLKVLVHETEVEVERCDIRVVFSCGDLENGESSVHVLESS
jgi:hypothetical protein